ncbi:MAG: UvrD-helicase domain-containing protein [Moraxellaceae bacterium]
MAAHLLKALDLYTLPLAGTQLVEASAGTGKTWTIAGLYVRLLLETDATLDRLLVVTFTKAATAELRERLRARLVEVEQALLAGNSDDIFCQWALEAFRDDEPVKQNGRPGAGRDPATFVSDLESESGPESEKALGPGLRRGDGEENGLTSRRQAAIAKLTQSLRIFDEAAIHTIHGFCQRVLDDVQLPALLDEPDIVPDERDWLPGLTQEAWIRHCRNPLLADLLAADSLSPAIVQRDVEVLLLKPYLQISSVDHAIDAEQLAWRREALHKHWLQDREAIVRDVSEADALSRSKDHYKALDDMLAALDFWLTGEGALEKALRRLTPEKFAEKKKQKGRMPQHAFWNELADWFTAADGLLLAFRRTLVDDVRAALVAHKQAMGLLSYQDLLGLLAGAVEDERLAADIRSRYRAALIDEFQDTDPLQFRIFETLFGAGSSSSDKDSARADGELVESIEAQADLESPSMTEGNPGGTSSGRTEKRASGVTTDFPLYLVGDPKQAIYSFRGADIFTYLRARQSAEGRYTLGTNRRSTPELVQAVNGVFTRHRNPFLLSDLGFPLVDAVATKENLLPAQAPFQCWLLPAEGDKPLGKEAARDFSVQATVAEISRLLREARQGAVKIGEKPLRPGDIAVLVPKHRDGRAVVEALAAAAIPAVIRSQDSVFATAEAVQMQSLLEAVAEPGREGRVKAAFLSPLMGGTVEALYAAQESDAQWSALMAILLEARERWQRRGFMPMWEGLLREFRVYERVLAAAGGERGLTNLRHLATLMQHQADADPVPERQLAWLREQVQEEEASEENQLRLESDAERVQVLTIHVSKGLEYPVVFCPFLWDGSLLHKSDDDRAEYRAGADSLLDIGSERFAHAQTRMATERLAEKLRVLYVALTRAKYRCYGIWGRVKDSETSPFSWLLLGGNTEGDPDADILARDLKDFDHEYHAAALQKLAAEMPQAFAWQEINPDITAPPLALAAEAQGMPQLPPFSRNLERRWRVSSFTGLSESAHAPDQSPLQESPDHDAQSPLLSVPVFQEEIVVPEGIHAFPRGAAAGVFWHAVLEEAVADAILATGGNKAADMSQRIADLLQEHALAPDWQAQVQSTLAQLLTTPLDAEGATLGALESARVEMEFIYPVGRLTPSGFLELPDVAPRYRDALTALDFPLLAGYLKGFIDLIYRHDGRYYVLDYKTNWLGPDDSAYTQERMQQAMADSHYYLQYWLYVLALHRHLKTVKKDYDYERDMGGVRYLFLRGMASATRGVYAARPSLALVDALDALMQGETA